MGRVEVEEDIAYGEGVGEEREDPHLAAAVRAEKGKQLEDAGEELGSANPGGPLRRSCGSGVVRHGWTRHAPGPAVALGIVVVGVLRLRPTHGGHLCPQTSVEREHAVVAVAVDVGRGNEPGQAREELERGEEEDRAPVGRGLGQPVQQAGVGRVEGVEAVGGAEAHERKRRPSAVTHEALEAGPVVVLDPYGGVDRKPAAALPGGHVVSDVSIEEVVAAKVAKHAPLDDGLELGPALRRERRGVAAPSPTVQRSTRVVGRR